VPKKKDKKDKNLPKKRKKRVKGKKNNGRRYRAPQRERKGGEKKG